MKMVLEKKFRTEMIEEGSWGSRDLGVSDNEMLLYVSQDNPGRGFIEWNIIDLERNEEIGLRWDPRTMELQDYDGVMCLAEEAIALIREYGIIVGQDFM